MIMYISAWTGQTLIMYINYMIFIFFKPNIILQPVTESDTEQMYEYISVWIYIPACTSQTLVIVDDISIILYMSACTYSDTELYFEFFNILHQPVKSDTDNIIPNL